MSTPSARRTASMTLFQLVDRYRSLAGGFGKPVALAAFGLATTDTEHLFSSFDEDYHISRFFHFSDDRTSTAARYTINGEPVTHISLDPEIHQIL